MSTPDSTATRSRILNALRGAHRAALPLPSLAPYYDGPFGRGGHGPRLAPGALADSFKTAARAWRAEVVDATMSSWQGAVQQVLVTRNCRRVAVGAAGTFPGASFHAADGIETLVFDRPLPQWKAELFDTVDAAITGAQAGIADTGSLWLTPGPHEPRSLSLVPPLHIAVLPAGRLYASLAAACGALAPEKAMPSNLLLITGPSKTADIQQTLAYGAHGPKELVIVLVDDVSDGSAASS